jgi:hypothetical protein
MLGHVALVRTYVSEVSIASVIRVTRIGELGTALAVTKPKHAVRCTVILVTLKMVAVRYSETSILKRATWCNIPEKGFLHSHHSENIKLYIALTGWVL